jgi:hypothetical protein
MSAPSGVPTPDSTVTPPAASARRGHLLLIKGIITVALLGFLATKIDLSSVVARLQSASLVLLALAVVIVTLEVPLAAFRWMLLAQRTGAAMSYRIALQLSFAGLFFGQVLPASIGGDVVRGYLAYRNGVAWQPLVSSLILDRVIALLAAVVLILLAMPWMLGQALGALTWTAGISAALVLILIAGLFVDKVPLPGSLKDRAIVRTILVLIGQTRKSLASAEGLLALGVSIVIHVMTIFVVVAVGSALEIDGMLMPSVLVVPTALIAAAVPISLNGWGIREGVMVAGFALFGIAQGDAFLISVLLGLSVVISALPGGFTWLTLR